MRSSGVIVLLCSLSAATSGWGQATANTNCYSIANSLNCRTTVQQQEADEGFWSSFGQAFSASHDAQGKRPARAQGAAPDAQRV
jgi:hypothetical protein